jgi:PAS domain S-box-containing protein
MSPVEDDGVPENDSRGERLAPEYDFHKVIDSMAIMAWSAFPDGRCEHMNQHWLDYGGVSQKQVQGWGWTARLHPDDLESLMSAWNAALASGETASHEARMLRRDGVYRWFLFLGNPLRDAEGSIVRWFGVNVDVEDRVRAQEALRASEDETLAKVRTELSYMTRVASMGALTASMLARSISRSPASSRTRALASGCWRRILRTSKGARKNAERIIRDSNRAADVIARLRALFTKKRTANEPLDLNDATREVVALHASELRRHRVTLRTEFATDLPSIRGDRIQLQQVILNLLLNASTAMSEVEDRLRELVIETGWGTDGVRLSVKDSGIGLASEEGAERLFEPFYTTKADGMGIGLAVSRTIVESHGGRLWAKPNDGPGATFTFSIPALSDGQALHETETNPGDAEGASRAAPRATMSMTHDPRLSAIAWVYGDQLGFSKAPSITEPEVTRNMARSLLAAAAGNGTVSESEREWIAGYCAAKGYAREIVAEIETATPPSAAEVKELMQLGVLRASARILVYDAIRAASVDGYNAGEVAAVRTIAQALGIEVSVVEEIERLVGVERDLKQKRIQLLMPEGHPNLQK